MKRKTLLVLAVLVTALACLFTSCSGSVEPPRAEECGYVTFGNGSSRTLSTEYGIKSYDDLNWLYTSHKMDSYGLTGETDVETAVPAKSNGKGIGSGSVGPFSQGAWQFTLYAYEITGTTRTLVYQGTSSTVVLKGGETKAVPVSVSLMGDTGLIDVSQAYFEWANGSDATGNIYVTIELVSDTSTGSPYFFGPLTRSSDKYIFGTSLDSLTVAADYYTCTVNAYMLEDVNVTEEGSKSVKADATPLATQTFGLRVYGNATTYIKGNLTEGLFADVVFKVAEQDMKVFVPTANGSAEITDISVTPSGTGTTSVSFSNGALSDIPNDATLQLDVKVTPVESSNEKFNINGVDSNNKSAFAGIDIALMQTTSDGNSAPVDSFNNNSSTTATVTTYIATGLSNVVVKYAGNPNEVIDSTYDSVTGCLTFTTSHFSEYYVLADCVAVNVNKNIGYNNFAEAIGAVSEWDTIKLCSEVDGDRITITKSMTIDGNGHTLTDSTSGGRAIWITQSNVTLAINDLTIDGKGNCERGLQVNNLEPEWNNAHIILNNCDIVGMSYYAINLASRTTVEMEINDSYISGWAAINAYGTGNIITVNRSKLEGINDKGLSSWNNFSTICLEGDTTGHSTLGSSDYTVVFNDCEIIAKQTTGNKQRAIGFNSNSMNSSVLLNNTTITLGDEVYCSFANDAGTGNKIIVDGELIHESPEANCWYSNGDFFANQESGGMFTNLVLPFNHKWLGANEGVIIGKDIVLDEDIYCQMTSGTFYLYLDGYSVTGGSILLNDGVSVISDKEGLENSLFKASSEEKEIVYIVNDDSTFLYYVKNPLAYMDNFSFKKIDGESTEVVFSSDFSKQEDKEFFCPGHYDSISDEKKHNDYISTLEVKNGVAEIYASSAWRSFDGLDSSKTYELSYIIKIDESYNRDKNNALTFNYGEKNTWKDDRLIFAMDNEKMMVYLASNGSIGAEIEKSKAYQVKTVFEPDSEDNTKINMTTSVMDGNTELISSSSKISTSTGYYWDIYLP